MNGLTKREIDVAALIADGLSNKEIARALGVTVGTVKMHLHKIYGKLRVPNRTVLAMLAARTPAEEKRND